MFRNISASFRNESFLFQNESCIVFCPILARAAFRKSPASYRNKSSSKRNDSCIGFIVLIPEQLLHSGKDLQKIRPSTKWYSSTRLTNAYTRIVKLFEIYYTNDFGFLPLLI